MYSLNICSHDRYVQLCVVVAHVLKHTHAHTATLTHRVNIFLRSCDALRLWTSHENNLPAEQPCTCARTYGHACKLNVHNERNPVGVGCRFGLVRARARAAIALRIYINCHCACARVRVVHVRAAHKTDAPGQPTNQPALCALLILSEICKRSERSCAPVAGAQTLAGNICCMCALRVRLPGKYVTAPPPTADDDDSSVDGGWWWIHPCPPWCMYWRPVRVLVRRAAREQQSVRVVDWDG